MKPFLGIDLTSDKKNTQENGLEFLALKPSLSSSQSLDSSTEKAVTTIKNSKLPLPVRIIGYICGILSLIILSSIIKSDVSIAEGYNNAPWVYWIGIFCFVVWIITWILGKKKSKTVLSTEESEQSFSALESVTKSIYTELDIPSNAPDVDILSFYYKEKDGNIKLVEKGMQFAQYFNPVFKVFMDSENLYLANTEGKYAFPLSSLTTIHTVKKRIRIMEWNKEERPNKGIYKQYKISIDNYGCVHCKHYHILEIHHNNEIYGIYIPCYELPVFEKLTGLKTQA